MEKKSDKSIPRGPRSPVVRQPDYALKPAKAGDKRDGDREKRPPKEEKPIPEPSGMPPRRAALDIASLLRKGRTLDEALDECRTFDALDGADRGMARAIATHALRRRGTLDHIIAPFISRPLPERGKRVMDILRLAAAQSFFLETPPHAVVSTAVQLAKDRREIEGYAPLVNAVARKVSELGPEAVKSAPARVDTPGWMWRAWERAYGPAKTKAVAAAHQKEAALDVTLKPDLDKAEWAEKLGGKVLPTGSIRIEGTTSVKALPGFDDGAWWVQDAAAALPAKLLGDITDKLVIDLCAAPGGKTMQLSAAGARVIAVDKYASRLDILKENLARTKLNAASIAEDAMKWSPSHKADAVLLDAPCTATGTIRRHPDILWSKTTDDVTALADFQKNLIRRALTLLLPGGMLVYCVCSLQPEEGERQIKSALAKHSSLKRLPIEADEIGGLAEAINRDGDLRTLPSMMGGMDGFFAARLIYQP